MDFRSDILSQRDRLYRLALGITMHTGEAEDVVQETMIRAWERRSEWPMIKNVSGWLALICRNLALDSLKRQKRSTPLQADVSTDPSNSIEARDTIAYIIRLAGTLPPPQDEIFRLRDIEGLSYHDIAEQLALSENQVKVYLHRARGQIRKQIVNKT